MSDIGLVFKIAIFGFFIALFNLVLKQAGKEEWAQMLTLAGIIVVLLMMIPLFHRLFQDVRAVFGL